MDVQYSAVEYITFIDLVRIHRSEIIATTKILPKKKRGKKGELRMKKD
jgi:hypothetical protein